MGGEAWLFSLVLAIRLLDMDVFEAGAWAIQGFMSGTYITIQKS